ncbi:MAG: hypothetical protein ISS52_07705 [Dehalococcoidia bacterium]|nr:hypothetical protein [Dehalococcoidia bacterium]
MVEKGHYTATLEVKGRDEIVDVSPAIKSKSRQMVAMRKRELAANANSMKDALITLDKKRRITCLNLHMEQMLAEGAADVVTKSVSKLEEVPSLLALARLVQTESPDEEVALSEPYELVVSVHSSRLKR